MSRLSAGSDTGPALVIRIAVHSCLKGHHKAWYGYWAVRRDNRRPPRCSVTGTPHTASSFLRIITHPLIAVKKSSHHCGEEFIRRGFVCSG